MSESPYEESPGMLSKVAFLRLSIAGHIIVPLIFGFVAYLSIWEHICLSWELVVVIMLMSLPFLLPLLATYLKSAGKDGVGFHNPFFAIKSLVELSKQIPVENALAKDSAGAIAPDSIAALTPSAQKILRTLWHYQKTQPTDEQRWGFGIHPAAPDYPAYNFGVTELILKSLVMKDTRGLVYLSTAGVQYCKKHNADIGDDDIWDKFGSAQ